MQLLHPRRNSTRVSAARSGTRTGRRLSSSVEMTQSRGGCGHPGAPGAFLSNLALVTCIEVTPRSTRDGGPDPGRVTQGRNLASTRMVHPNLRYRDRYPAVSKNPGVQTCYGGSSLSQNENLTHVRTHC